MQFHGQQPSRNRFSIVNIDTLDISKVTNKVFDMFDAIVEKVGEEHVVQVITDNAANSKVAGEKLIQKRTKLF